MASPPWLFWRDRLSVDDGVLFLQTPRGLPPARNAPNTILYRLSDEGVQWWFTWQYSWLHSSFASSFSLVSYPNRRNAGKSRRDDIPPGESRITVLFHLIEYDRIPTIFSVLWLASHRTTPAPILFQPQIYSGTHTSSQPWSIQYLHCPQQQTHSVTTKSKRVTNNRQLQPPLFSVGSAHTTAAKNYTPKFRPQAPTECRIPTPIRSCLSNVNGGTHCANPHECMYRGLVANEKFVVDDQGDYSFCGFPNVKRSMDYFVRHIFWFRGAKGSYPPRAVADRRHRWEGAAHPNFHNLLECHWCRQDFADRDSLKRHLEKVHRIVGKLEWELRVRAMSATPSTAARSFTAWDRSFPV